MSGTICLIFIYAKGVGSLSSEPIVIEEVQGVDDQRSAVLPVEFRPPRAYVFILILAGLLSASVWLYQPGDSFINWYAGILWCVPIGMTLIGLTGAMRARRVMKAIAKQPFDQKIDNQLVVVIPTIGRRDTLPALERVITSFVEHLPPYFRNYRIDVVVEEGCDVLAILRTMEVVLDGLRVLVVPKNYCTRNGTEFKARANQYALEQRRKDAECSDNAWVLHMDDDTAAGGDTAREVARFIAMNAMGPKAKHVAQGVLTYVRACSPNWLTWLADSIRASDDTTRFAALTGGGTPLAGLHGELLLVRASIEAEIGWDFGPREIVEDSRFALMFAMRCPGKSAWIPARCYGASPATIRDFQKQRDRWAWGIIALAFNRQIALRRRLLIMYCSVWWAFGILQHAVPVLVLGWALGDMNISPMIGPLVSLWSLNMAYVMWGHWEGLRINAHASGMKRPRLLDKLCVLPLVYLFSIMEGVAGTTGALRYITKMEIRFVVIGKPH